MKQQPLAFERFGELKAYVERQQCEKHDLEVGVFDITHRVLTRGSAPCGVYFCIYGPRSVKLSAIWETDQGRVLFYDANGQRWLEARLSRGPHLSIDIAP